MDPDLLLVIGLVIGLFAIPAFFADLFSPRIPRLPTLGLLLAGGLITYAYTEKPGGYDPIKVPEVIVDVIGRYIL